MSIRGWLFKQYLKITVTHSMDYATERESLEKTGQFFKVPKEVQLEKTEIAGMPGEWQYEAGIDKDRVVVFLHGGSYCFGSVSAYRFFTAGLAKKSKLPVLSLEYSLAPEHPFPSALNEVVAVYSELLNSGFPAERIAFLGDSAGAGLAVAAAMQLRDLRISLPAAIALLSPFMDATFTSKSCTEKVSKDVINSIDFDKKCAAAYANGEDFKNPLISPLFGSFKDLPPIFVHEGTEDIYLDDSTRTISKAIEERVDVTSKIWEGMVHDFTIFLRGTPECSKSGEALSGFLRQKLQATR